MKKIVSELVQPKVVHHPLPFVVRRPQRAWSENSEML
jgi:hypothetical protein